MVSKFIPKNAAKAIYKHYDLLSSACINHSGILSFTEDEKILEELKSQKLLYVLDENLEYRLNGKVRTLIEYLEGHFRFHQRHGLIAENLEALKEAIAKYNRIYHKADLRSRSHAVDEVRDYIFDLTDNLHDSIISFYHLVDEDYSLVSDIDEKLYQMNRCSAELGKINEIFKRLTVGKLEEEFQSDDPTINRLIFKDLSKIVAVGINELSVLSDKVVKRIDKLNQEKQSLKHNHLIDIFAKNYEDKPDFIPNIDSYDIPDKFMDCEPLELCYLPDLSPSAEDIPDIYREYAAEIALSEHNIKEKISPEKSPEFRDNRGQTVKPEKTEIEKRVDSFVQATLSRKVTKDLSASLGYKLLKIDELDISLVDWIYILMLRYLELPAVVRVQIVLEPIKLSLHPTFSGNIFFNDIVFKKKNSFSHVKQSS
ncbi:MAG: hypothetical protein ACI4ND_07140 [Succinivibrio sp.]